MIEVLVATLLALPSAVAPPEPAKPDPAKAESPTPPPGSAPPPTGSPDLPSLDDLLGTTPEKSPPASTQPDSSQPTAPDQQRADLDRLLTGEELGDAFRQAVALMDDAAARLERARDTGLSTQRVQEDVVKRLDQLLASLEQQQQQQQQQQSSSSSSSRDQQGQRNQPNQRQQSQSQSSQAGDGSRDWDGPPKQEGALRPGLDSARAAWGALPQRIREMLLQGTEDPFSARYRTMTESYYRRLAEDRK